MDTETIYYQSPIGVLEITGTETVVTGVYFINSYKGKKIEEASIAFDAPVSPALKKCVEQLNAYFEGNLTVFDLPLACKGTGFQESVWTALLDIPYGQTISYLTLSKRIGNVKAIRAVGTANGSNPISIVVPCHRVIGSNGSLVGYGGDLWRKQWLLEHENKFGNGVQQLF